MKNVPRADGLKSLTDKYDVLLCDVWGVLHNGLAVWPQAAEALANARESGLAVVMITNAPRPHQPVLKQVARLGCPPSVFDALVTSGDVTRSLIRSIEGNVFHIGPERDYALYEGLDVEFSGPEEAGGIVCTGLFNDRGEHPEDYIDRFKTYIDKGLPFICANPDIVVEVGDEMLWCSGALAREYKKLGGDTRIVGKPHKPIYDLALEKAASALGKKPGKERILAIGDGLPTDIAGADNYEIDALFISGGIHAAEYQGDEEAAKLNRFLADNNASPAYWMRQLHW